MGLSLRDIDYVYGRGETAVPALSGVTVAVEPGELVLVLGATGSGKSTLLRTAAGLLAPTAGSATIDGLPLDLESARGAVGLIFQEPEHQLFGDTVLEDVAFGPSNLGLDRQAAHAAARAALTRVGLEPDAFAERSPFSLSGGEARRAAVAGVLSMTPRYLLADEPTAGLDARGRRAVRQLLVEMRERTGIVVVSHAAEEFLSSADRVVMLREGSVGWAGTPAEAMRRPDVFAECGLRPPELIEFQVLAAERTRAVPGPYSMDVSAVARSAAAVLGEH